MTGQLPVLKRPVFFIGFMGAGKTSVARKLARMCALSSVDMDTYLERREGRKIKEIFASEGEDTSALLKPMCSWSSSRRTRCSCRAVAA